MVELLELLESMGTKEIIGVGLVFIGVGIIVWLIDFFVINNLWLTVVGGLLLFVGFIMLASLKPIKSCKNEEESYE